MPDEETWWDRFLDKHRRIDRVDTWLWVHRPRVLWRRHLDRREMARWHAGTTFLEHGNEPAVIIELDDYDGYTAVSMVDGRTMGGSIFHCGPEPVTWREAMKLANKMREEQETADDT